MTSSKNPCPRVAVKELPGPDFTVYCAGKPEYDEGAQPQPEPSEDAHSYDGSFKINHDDGVKTARGVACQAYDGSYWSITLRCDADKKEGSPVDYLETVEDGLKAYAARIKAREDKAQTDSPDPEARKDSPDGKARKNSPPKARDYLGYCPKGEDKYSKPWASLDGDGAAGTNTGGGAKHSGPIFLNEIYPLCKELYDILRLTPAASPAGLITLTGATESSKSLIARGLIFLFLQAAAKHALEKGSRRPHLLTFEDPIEEYYIKDPATGSPPELEDLIEVLAALNIDYTPRQRARDAASLAKVIHNAKRQTPALLFVGETRDPKEWKDLLNFAGSGHLVVTTSHAGSVVEAMSQILRETETETASQRSEAARRIIGVVNIRTFNPSHTDKSGQSHNLRALLPAVWKSTTHSINNLVADGLSSILPALDREWAIGYYGRTYFARQLMHHSRTTQRFKDCKAKDAFKEAIKRQAMEWDIRGI